MNTDFIDPRTAALAAATAITHCDATGLADALANLPPLESHSGDIDINEEHAFFCGSGVAG